MLGLTSLSITSAAAVLALLYLSSVQAIECSEAPEIPTPFITWPLTEDNEQSTFRRFAFWLDRSSPEYQKESFGAPKGYSFNTTYVTEFESGSGYWVSLINEQTAKDAIAGEMFVVSLFYGDWNKPDYVKRWFISGFDSCGVHVDENPGYDLGKPRMRISQYFPNQ